MATSKKGRWGESRNSAPYSQNAILSQLGKRMLLAHNVTKDDASLSAMAAHCSQSVFVDNVQTEVKAEELLLSKRG